MLLPHYLRMLHDAESMLVDAYRMVAATHAAVADVAFSSLSFARADEEHAFELGTITSLRYPAEGDSAVSLGLPDRMLPAAFESARQGPLGLLRDLAELQQLAVFVETAWELTGQAASALRDHDLIALAERCSTELGIQSAWLHTCLKKEAAQALLVAGP